VILGLLVSLVLDTASGATIVVVGLGIFAIVLGLKKLNASEAYGSTRNIKNAKSR
jgi:ABC-type Mn2+/Zn2+ transport system permease subunit